MMPVKTLSIVVSSSKMDIFEKYISLFKSVLFAIIITTLQLLFNYCMHCLFRMF